MAKLGEHIPRMLSDRGFDTAFSVPGTDTIELYRSIESSGLRVIDVRNAAQAAFMAEGYARVNDAPAVCIAQRGPALAALAASLTQAWEDGVPLLVLTTRDPARAAAATSNAARRGNFLAGLCVAHFDADDMETLIAALDGAARALFRGRPGPVLVEIDADAFNREGGALADTAARQPAPLPDPAAPPPERAAEIILKLTTARHPVLVLGGGAARIPADTLAALAERMQAPVLMTSNARGVLDRDHPLVVGGCLDTQPVRELLDAADAVIAIGADLFSPEWGANGAAAMARGVVTTVAPQAAAPDAGASPAPSTDGDPGAIVAMLLENMPEHAEIKTDHAGLRERAFAAIPSRLSRHRALIDGIFAHLPEAVVFADPCEPTMAGVMCAMPPAPRRWIAASGGRGTPGHALPAAVGAKLADARRPVLALMAETALTDMLGAMATAVEANAHIVVLVWNATGFGDVRDAMELAGIRARGVEFTGVDLQPVSRGLGVTYGRVYGEGNLREALRGAIMRPSPTVLELREDYWFG